ncbi:MAG: helix-turn-helix domain-containing protein [Flavobacterium sp.]
MFDVLTIKEVKNTIGGWCKQLRKESNMSQQELANELAMSRITILNLENGDNCTLDTLLKVLQYYDQMQGLYQFINQKAEITDSLY